MVWMWAVITKPNTLLKLKEVGSHSKDATRCIDPAVLRVPNPSKFLGRRTNQHSRAGFLYKKSHDHMRSDITHDITAPISDVTSGL